MDVLIGKRSKSKIKFLIFLESSNLFAITDGETVKASITNAIKISPKILNYKFHNILLILLNLQLQIYFLFQMLTNHMPLP